MAMEHEPFVENGNFPLPCWFTGRVPCVMIKSKPILMWLLFMVFPINLSDCEELHNSAKGIYSLIGQFPKNCEKNNESHLSIWVKNMF